MPFNLPILLTWLRIVAIPLLIAVYYLPAGWATGHERDMSWLHRLFMAAAFTDWADGFLARKLNQTSAFGAFLDPVADKLMVAAALIVLVQLGRADAIVPTIIIGREITISALREWMAKIGASKSVAVSMLGKDQDRRADGRDSDAALRRPSSSGIDCSAPRKLADLDRRAY
jgi:cardiolipin synthase